jgi:hypothetical protein
LASTPSFAQLPAGTQFFPGINGGQGGTNPDGSFIHPSGLAQDGNPNQFQVGGNIEEYIEIKSVDDVLELGNLGGPEKVGRVKSVSGTGTTPSPTATEVTRQPAENGFASVEVDANTYITVTADYGADMTNVGLNGALGGGDDFTLPTHFRVAAKGREFKFGITAAQSSPTVYTPYQGSVASAGTSKVTFSPGYASGIKIMSEVERNGLNNYYGQYSTTISLSYYKF